MWQSLLPVSKTWPPGQLETFIEQYRLTIGMLKQVALSNVKTPGEASDTIRRLTRRHLEGPAQLLECPFSLEDLVLPLKIKDMLEDITCEARKRTAFWEQAHTRRLFPQGRGLLVLFSGPPGTGKTMAAQVMAARLGLDLFRIDLSTVVSKYVGETSRNLEKILSLAAQTDVMLLFDEADALFGKRTEIKDAHDRYANTETGYLLQAIESYQGIALMATNKKGNIDSAFIRRFRYMLEFPRPNQNMRAIIWQRIVCGLAGRDEERQLHPFLKTLAREIELTGAQIKYAVLSGIFSAKREGIPLSIGHLVKGVERELGKEGKYLSLEQKERIKQ
jgi:SpoVK/Ycf46/Vps4 family AAA+-type ATPase